MPGAFGAADEVDAQGGGGRRAGHRRRRPGRHRHLRRAVHGRRAARRRPAHRGLRLRHQAHDPAPPRPGSARSRSCPAATPAAEVLAREPDGVFLSNGPGDPAAVDLRGRGHPRPGRPGAGLRHLPRPPAAGHRARRHDPQAARSATTAATTRCAAWPPAGSRSPARTTTTRWPRARSGRDVDVTHVNLNDGVIEGIAGRRPAGLQRAVPPRGGPRPARRRLPVRRVRRRSSTPREPEGALMPRRDRHRVDPADRRRTHRHRPGLRVRLLGHPGLQGAAGRGLPGDPGQLEPGHDHDRPRLRRRHLRRAARRRPPGRRSSSASGPTPCCPPSAARPRSTWPWSWSSARRVGVPGTPELIGANAEAIATAEDRERFKVAMQGIGLDVPPSATAHTLDEAMAVVERIGLPGRRSARRTSSAARAPASPPRRDEFERLAATGLAASPISEILIERSIAGWKEYELEVMRDRADNCVVICSIENLDPMGVHTGDSITVAPGPDAHRRRVPGHARRGLRLHPPGRRRDRRVERAVRARPDQRRHGHHRDEPPGQPVVGAGVEGHRVPDRQDRRQARRRLHARRDPQRHHPQDAGQLRADHRLRGHQGAAVGVREVPGQPPGVLGTSMQSVGEAMAIGRTFPESLQKALRSLEHGRGGLNCDPAEAELDALDDDELRRPGRDRHPRPARSSSRRRCAGASPSTRWPSARGSTRGSSTRSLRIVEEREHLAAVGARRHDPARLEAGQAARLQRRPAGVAVGRRPRRRCAPPALAAGVRPTFKTVDTCGAEFDGRDAVPLLDLRGRGRGRRPAAAARCSSSARAPTASARASSSTTAACTPASPWPTPASRP